MYQLTYSYSLIIKNTRCIAKASRLACYSSCQSQHICQPRYRNLSKNGDWILPRWHVFSGHLLFRFCVEFVPWKKRHFWKSPDFRSSKSWVASPPVFVLLISGKHEPRQKDRLEPTERYRGFPTHPWSGETGGANMNWLKQFVWCPHSFIGYTPEF